MGTNTEVTDIDIFAVAQKKPAKAVKSARPLLPGTDALNIQAAAFVAARAAFKNAEAELKMLEGSIKPALKDLWWRLYEKTGKNPGTCELKTDAGAVLLLPMDKYLSVPGDVAAQIASAYPGSVEESVEYSFAPELLKKYATTISKALAAVIPADDLSLLLVAEKKFSVVKGTINKLQSRAMLDMVQPIFALKTV